MTERHYRDRFAIMANMLEGAVDGADKTRIVYHAHLSGAQSHKYLQVLTDCGLLAKNGDSYTTTPKGHNFIAKYNDMVLMVVP